MCKETKETMLDLMVLGGLLTLMVFGGISSLYEARQAETANQEQVK